MKNTHGGVLPSVKLQASARKTELERTGKTERKTGCRAEKKKRNRPHANEMQKSEETKKEGSE